MDFDFDKYKDIPPLQNLNDEAVARDIAKLLKDMGDPSDWRDDKWEGAAALMLAYVKGENHIAAIPDITKALLNASAHEIERLTRENAILREREPTPEWIRWDSGRRPHRGQRATVVFQSGSGALSPVYCYWGDEDKWLFMGGNTTVFEPLAWLPIQDYPGG